MMEPGYCTDVSLVRIIDGDTLEVKFERTFKVRLIGPPLRDKKHFNIAEKATELGQKAITFLKEKIKVGEIIRLFIPSENPSKLMDINSFDRIHAKVYHQGENIAELLDQKGFQK